MLINLRNALMAGKRLPYDAEVEYLESTGTQYIDTGVVFSKFYSFALRARLTPTYNESDLFGAYYQTDTHKMVCGCYRNFIFGFNPPGTRIDSATLGTSEIDVDISYEFSSAGARTLTVNGAAYTASTGYITNRNITLFRGNPSYDGAFKCYSFKIYDTDGTTLVRDLIPVRVGTVGYLYDRVSGKLFGNAGTGDFVLGQDVVPVEYIESHGTEYIDTEIKPTITSILRTSIRLMEAANTGCFVGALDGGAHRFHLTRTDFGLNGYFGYSNGNVEPFVDCNLELNAKEWYCKKDGVTTASTSTKVIPSVSVFLFARHYSSSYDRPVKARMGFCEILDNDLPVRKFLSVRVGTDATSWEGAMMDVLTRRIYRNAGTGAFTYGNDLPYPIPSE